MSGEGPGLAVKRSERRASDINYGRASPALRFDQVPEVSIKVAKDGNDPIRLMARVLRKDHARTNHRGVARGKIASLEEERDTTAGLVANARDLFRANGASKKQPGASIG